MDNGELDEDVCPICKASLEDAKDTAKWVNTYLKMTLCHMEVNI